MGSVTRSGLAKLVGTVVALVVLGFFPIVFTNPSVTTIGVYTLLFMACATAWNTFSGYSGYISLGHAAFFGTGAYILAIISTRLNVPAGESMFALVPVAGVGAAVVAVPFGLIALRTRRHTFVVITIAVFFTFQLLATNLSITEGSSGIQVPTPTWTAPSFNNPFYYVTLGIVIFVTALSWAIRRSVFGLQLLAIRDDEDRARGLGVHAGRVKLIAFVVSAVPTGMCGAVYAYFLGQIFPQFAYDPLFDLSVALMALFGGIGTLAGPLLGALVLESLQQYFTIQFSNEDIYLVVYGALFLLVLLWMPRGLIPTVGDLVRRTARRRPGGAPAAVGAVGPAGPTTPERAPSPAVAGGFAKSSPEAR